MPTPLDRRTPPQRTLLSDPRLRDAALQLLVVGMVALAAYAAIGNAVENLRRADIASGFGFLGAPAGFDVSQALVPYSSSGYTYGRAFLVGLLNTLVVAAIGIVLATLLGFLVGIARLSTNWILSTLAAAYVETLRNLPLLLQLLFWYYGVLASLPGPRDSIQLGESVYLNVRGLSLPKPVFGPGAWLIGGALVVAVATVIALRRWARRRQARTGQGFPLGLAAAALLSGLPTLVWLAEAMAGLDPIRFEMPQPGTYNLGGGLRLLPEFVALVVALTTYTAAFVAEIVRAGVLAVPKGQTEAARALGLRPGTVLRLVVIPQAMRVIVPPLTSQYLNLTKNSSLAVAIGYPDLVHVFMGTVLNQTGQAVEAVAITMGVYLAISLVTSGAMNAYNRRVATAHA